MKKSIKRLSLAVGVPLLILCILFVINQTIQIVDFASRVSPILATIVFWGLIAIYAVVIVVPVAVFLRLPGQLRPPRSEESEEFPNYLEALKQRLRCNPRLKGNALSERRDIEEALASLRLEADEVIRKTASRIFIATAVSQNGRLDALFVLSALSQMVWQIAHIFYQRPRVREFVNLYANVAATAFLASELQDIDLHEQLTPILSSHVFSIIRSVPGMHLLVHSILTGSADAFLVLRVGIITKRYCGSLSVGERRAIRRAATLEAARMLGPVIGQGAAKISKAGWDITKEKIGSKISSTTNQIRGTGKRLFSKVTGSKTETPGSEEPETKG
jgi:Domain of unknown function (DUF697)